jgi:hypothetical protein
MDSYLIIGLCCLGLAIIIMAVNQYCVRTDLTNLAEALKAIRASLSALRAELPEKEQP